VFRTVRVVAGTLRGRPLSAPPGTTTRPITDRVKETLFNILGHRLASPGELPAIDILDVFSGPGSLGIEALSRGARTCTFVERDRRALRSLRQNIGGCYLRGVTSILADNAWTMRPPETPDGFGLIFVDPPYRDGQDPLRIIDLLERLAIVLSDDGLMVYRCDRKSPALPVDEFRLLRCLDERAFGRMRVILLGHAADESLSAADAEADDPEPNDTP